MTKFEHEVTQALAELRTAAKNTERKVDGLVGLYDRVTTLEVKQNECPAREAAQGVARRERGQLAASLISAAVAVIACIMAAMAARSDKGKHTSAVDRGTDAPAFASASTNR
jgi:hypothetical protein